MQTLFGCSEDQPAGSGGTGGAGGTAGIGCAGGGQSAPIADTGAPRQTTTGAMVTLDSSDSSDPGGGTLTYAWSETTNSGVTIKDADMETANFEAPPASANLVFELVVTNTGGTTVTDQKQRRQQHRSSLLHSLSSGSGGRKLPRIRRASRFGRVSSIRAFRP